MKIIILIITIILFFYLINRKSKSEESKDIFPARLPPEHQDKKPRKKIPKTIDDINIKNIELNEDFKKSLDLIENKNENLYITGNAGTGKSTLLKFFRLTTNKKVAVLAPTGVAAINVGGQTIHSFFKFPPKLIKKEDIKTSRDPIIFKKLDTIIIDEVSMVRADLMDGIDYSLRLNRHDMHKPFGGLQILLFGDLFQLPPVVRGKELQEYFNTVYGGPYFFCAEVFKNAKFKCIELKKIYRQTDDKFINILNSIRLNSLDNSLISSLNSRVVDSENELELGELITLTTTNRAASEINDSFLNKIKEKQYCFKAIIKGKFNESDFPTEYELKLKKGARVILLKNDLDKRWVNGTICNISSIIDDRVFIDIDGLIYELKKETWEKIEYFFDRKENRIEEKVIGSFTQFPLRLAWAITIHKSQGHTFERVFIDLGEGAFAHGQTYVALSRCRSLEGIKLKRPVLKKDVIFDPRIYEYSKVISSEQEI
jgi:ATP-dependent exoDNAse (exonuclease V) alpha subunit